MYRFIGREVVRNAVIVGTICGFFCETVAFDYDAYKPTTLRQLVADESPLLSAEALFNVSADARPSCVVVTYAGKKRSISPLRLSFVASVLRSWGLDVPPFQAEELLVENGAEFWMPAQQGIDKYFAEELAPGDRIRAYISLLGGITVDGKPELVFIINEFQKVVPADNPPTAMKALEPPVAAPIDSPSACSPTSDLEGCLGDAIRAKMGGFVAAVITHDGLKTGGDRALLIQCLSSKLRISNLKDHLRCLVLFFVANEKHPTVRRYDVVSVTLESDLKSTGWCVLIYAVNVAPILYRRYGDAAIDAIYADDQYFGILLKNRKWPPVPRDEWQDLE